MQKRIRAQFATRGAKVEVLVNYWDKIVGEIGLKASKFHDNEAFGIVRKLIAVPEEIRHECLW